MTLLTRAFRHFFLDRSYERYYPPERWERIYHDGRTDFASPAEEAHYAALVEAMRRYDSGSGAVLDVGCGDGLLFARYREKSGSELIGIDYSASAIEKAEARAIPNCRFLRADFRHWDPERTFSVVVFNESLYYVDDFTGLLRRAGSWLEQDGVIVISMFRRPVTRRMWKQIGKERGVVYSATVTKAGKPNWTIKVLTSPARSG